ncbi:MAG: hypothetical protein J6I76_03575 [Oribacterium sp.]|nr:hypothetical protein [Oribacterium sp.]
MFRLANFNEENTEEGSVYRYISVAVSKTIIDCLDEYLDDTEKYDVFFQYTFSDSFFESLSRYVLPKALCLDEGDDDAQAGYEFTFSKMRRMREKMLDQNAGYGYKYTCDIFSDIGIKPPLMLLGTEEANRIANEEEGKRIREYMDGFYGKITGEKERDGL